MKIAAYPKTLLEKEQYTAGDVAILYGVSHRTACKMFDTGELPGFKVPGSKERRVLHADIVAHVAKNPKLEFVLKKIVKEKPSES